MTTCPVPHRTLRLAVIVLAAGLLAGAPGELAGAPASLSAGPLHISAFDPAQAGPGVLAAASSPAKDAAWSEDDGLAADEGVIAYASRVTGDIHVMAPDGTGDRVLWTYPPAEVHWLALDLAWRPDGRELAFTSEHENACSWFDSDVYVIRQDGTGYRRITNSPACAVLATLPQGAVTVNVNNYTSTPIWVYVAGAPSVKWVNYSGTVTFDKVADFGPGVYQPSIGIYGLYRYVSYPPYADVEPGKTLAGGNITVMSLSGFQGFGAGHISWKAGGAALAYVLRSNSNLWQISASPAYGDTGGSLPINKHTKTSLVAWGPTPATNDQFLYVSGANLLDEGYKGIWLNTVGDTSGGERLVALDDSDAKTVYDIEWLPDGSGFLYSLFSVGLGYFVDIFRYDFDTGDITRLTNFPRDFDLVRGLSISPDGQRVVFERVVDEFDSNSSLWLMNIDGSGLRKLRDNAGRPAWGRTPQVVQQKKTYLPLITR